MPGRQGWGEGAPCSTQVLLCLGDFGIRVLVLVLAGTELIFFPVSGCILDLVLEEC